MLTMMVSLQGCGSDIGGPGAEPGPGGFVVDFGPSAVSVRQGTSTKRGITVTRTGGFAGPITYAITDVPDGLTANVETTIADQPSLILTASDAIQPATYPIVVAASASGLPDQRATIAVTIVSQSTSGTGLESVAVGNGTACALSVAGAAYCWGGNYTGEAGNGTTGTTDTPVMVSGGLTFATIALGAASQSACGLAPDGTAYCWGSNDFGQLGDGTRTARLVPTRSAVGLKFASLSVGSRHVCGIAPGFAAYCWGDNADGNLGDGTNVPSPTPVRVSGMLFKSVSAGDDYTCGLTPDGAAYCWGLGNYGQLGNGTTESSLTPVAVSGGLAFTSLAVGTYDVCGLIADGSAYCWGHNFYGEVGDGTTVGRSTPVAVKTDQKFVEIAAGVEHFCGVTSGGDAYCWGYNATGALGDGTTEHRSTPTLVSSGLKFRSIAVGNTHACAVRRGSTSDEDIAYCWGSAVLGDGSTTSSTVPVRVRWP